MKYHKQKYSCLKKCWQISKVFAAILVSLILASCADMPAVSYIGETVSIEELEGMTFGNETRENNAKEVSQEQHYSDTVYWTDSGEVWHIDKECSSLKKAREIFSGTESEAIAHNKKRICQKCGK